jgi:hypothetical protein
VHATASVEVPAGAIATFQLINPPEGYRYECRWIWFDDNVETSKPAELSSPPQFVKTAHF